jgi:uncharacterized membrane protein YqaE (UPF0057 family)
MTDVVENDILNGQYSLFQQILYGGVSHGVIIIPTHFFKLLFTLIFPPLGEIINAVSSLIIDSFPWITWDAIKKLFEYQTLNRIIYSFLLTSMFYIPGLIYTLSNLTTNTPNVPGTLVCNPDTGQCKDTSELDQPAKN